MSNVGFRAVLTLKNLRELRFACTSTAVGIEGAKFGEVSTLSVTQDWLEQTEVAAEAAVAEAAGLQPDQ